MGAIQPYDNTCVRSTVQDAGSSAKHGYVFCGDNRSYKGKTTKSLEALESILESLPQMVSLSNT